MRGDWGNGEVEGLEWEIAAEQEGRREEGETEAERETRGRRGRRDAGEIWRDFARNELRIMRQTNARSWKLNFTLSFEPA